MAEKADPCSSSSSDSEPEVAVRKPLPKRRRLFISDVPAVPVYSSKVQKSLQFFPESLKRSPEPEVLSTSDKEETEIISENTRCQTQSPSPPPPPRPRRKCPTDKILKQRFESLTSSLSAAKNSLQDVGTEADSDDVILIDATEPSESQELLLKVRCRADLYRVSVRMTDPLQRVVEHMGQTLKVHPNRILLLHRDRELAADATPSGLGLGVADIVDCIVETNSSENNDSGNLQLRVQGNNKNSRMEITVQKGEPLQVLMNRYRQAQGLGRRKLVFHFDGRRLVETWTPEELGMESGDVIEVWS
ncbi:NFATC2-interacting protein [Sceloporus undulatus]|uniref:NFATC2-interacting protein n=1 Tax=Sceloporus undulatus TaxID=8520 RepID=UPI001C4BFDD8|nr:NFATC2-interacting protein [Sceloporus undulatus]